MANKPYEFLPHSATIHRVPSPLEGKKLLPTLSPELIFISASVSIVETLSFLQSLKDTITTTIPPIIFVVDLTHSLNMIPGTTWADKAAVVDTTISINEFGLTLSRVMQL